MKQQWKYPDVAAPGAAAADAAGDGARLVYQEQQQQTMPAVAAAAAAGPGELTQSAEVTAAGRRTAGLQNSCKEAVGESTDAVTAAAPAIETRLHRRRREERGPRLLLLADERDVSLEEVRTVIAAPVVFPVTLAAAVATSDVQFPIACCCWWSCCCR